MSYLITFLIIPIVIFLNKYLIKENILLNDTGNKHQKFSIIKKVPLIGGFFILIFIFLFEFNISFKILALLTFSIGLFSDLNLLNSPKIRILLQSFFIFIFLFYADVRLENLRINFLENLLKNGLLNQLFLTFCIVVIINGTNFIDGMNANVLFYYFITFFIILKLDSNYNLFFSQEAINMLILLLLILIILNLYSKLFMGDSGSYLISLMTSYFLINLYLMNQFISPFFIVLLLWYPAYENLFSIIRKFNLGKSPIEPDNNHLHHLIMKFLKNYFKRNTSNNLTSLIINSFNFITIYLGYINIRNTQIQVLLILFNITFYSIVYFRLYKIKK